MHFTGTVQGAAARKFAGFTYRKPLQQPIDSVWTLDPERLNYADEYPRSVNPPSLPILKTVDLADYRVVFSGAGPDGMSTVTVEMLPNGYTASKVPVVVYTCKVAHPFTLRHENADLVLADVFRVGPGAAG